MSEPIKMIKGKTCTGCGHFHPNECKPQTGKGEGKKPMDTKKSKEEKDKFDTEKLEKKAEALAEQAEKQSELREKYDKTNDEYYCASDNGGVSDEELAALLKKAEEAAQQYREAASAADNLTNDIFEEFKKSGMAPSQGYGKSDRYRIGIEGFDAADLAPEAVPPMTKEEFRSRLQKRQSMAIDAKMGDLDERRMVDAVSGNDDYPWEGITQEPLSDVHIVFCVDNSGSMKQAVGKVDTTSKAFATATAIAIMSDVVNELNQSANEGGKFHITFIKWSCTEPKVVKSRDSAMTGDEMAKDYMSVYTGMTDVGYLIPLINNIQPIGNESTLVVVITDGEMGGEDILVKAMEDTNSGKIWALFGVGCANPLFDRVCWQSHEIQQTLFDAILDAVDRAWAR